ncbi:MAG TPA: sugar phosphate nucleotidyltransferase [Candidatus Saccharimonadales bacterium]|nr:sugar phosphate nucleotidyltransferase [Candidatus Saccharimonadales bacterium]
MKGFILAGGLATRLQPLTLVTNKHLLPVYKKPMIFYALESMKRAGIEEVLLSSSPDHAGQFTSLIKDGSDFGLRMYYTVQSKPAGIAAAISLAEDFAKEDTLLVLLGDGIFSYSLKNDIEKFEKKGKGAITFGMHMPTDSKQYGVIEIDTAGKVLSIEEKPEHPKSDIAQTGIYMYDTRVFDFIRELKPSARGELEVTDLNNKYVTEGTMECSILPWWIDAGTSHDELLRANNLVAEKVKNGEIN